jgi:hypothetical protein
VCVGMHACVGAGVCVPAGGRARARACVRAFLRVSVCVLQCSSADDACVSMRTAVWKHICVFMVGAWAVGWMRGRGGGAVPRRGPCTAHSWPAVPGQQIGGGMREGSTGPAGFAPAGMEYVNVSVSVSVSVCSIELFLDVQG